MPLFMRCPRPRRWCVGPTITGAHARDLEYQHGHRVNYLRYWVDEQAGKIFCLVEAPALHTAHEVHREAHGLVADEIYQVSEYS